jgi:hypothetical protein
MTLEHLSETQLTAYTTHSLDPDELLAVDDHLASCDECHKRLISIPEVAKLVISPLFESEDGPFHLDYEQHLEPYVDGTANDIDRELVDSHVAVCSTCAADLKDLREFKQQPVAAIAEDARRPSWKQWLPLPSNPVWATAAAGFVAVLILGVTVLLWSRYPAFESFQQVKTPSPEPSVAKEQPSPAPTGPTTTPSLQTNELTPAREEPLVTVYDAGGQLVLNKRGQLEGLQQLPPDLKESVERALATRRLGASPGLTAWTTGKNNLRSAVETQTTFGPLEPTDVVIETDRPTFRWRALEGALHYIVTIFDTKLRQVGSSGPVNGTAWTTPNSLDRGVTYSWQISALKDGETVVSPKPPLPEARFRVLDQRAFGALAKLKETVGSSHLVMGVYYWKHGLIAESEREFQALAKANPNSAAVTELLASIRSLRHQ